MVCPFAEQAGVDSRTPARVRSDYDAAGSLSGTPMMVRIFTNSRDSNRETCIWLMPISSAISDCERCSKNRS